MGWYLLCTALLLPISLPGPHPPLFPLRAVPFLCPPLPHLPDLIWSQSRCYAEIEDGWERYLSPELMTTAPFSAPDVEPAKLMPDENRKHRRIWDTLVDEKEIVLSARAHNNLCCTHPETYTYWVLCNVFPFKTFMTLDSSNPNVYEVKLAGWFRETAPAP